MRGRVFTRRVLIAGCTILAMFPLAWAVIASFLPESALFAGRTLVPHELGLEHYRRLLAERNFLLPIRNSLIVASTTTLLCLVLGAPCAWAIARFRVPGRFLILASILAVSMFPQIAIVPPLFIVLRQLHLINTFPGLILPYLTFAMPLTIWLLVGYFRQIPHNIEQAAAIDGAGRMRILAQIVLPISAPGLAATAILTFLYSWNEFLFALSFTLGPERHTVPVAIALFRGQYQVPWGEILAAAVIATIPVALLVLVFQRRIVQGLTRGSLKG